MFRKVLLIAMVSFTLNALFGPVQTSEAQFIHHPPRPCSGWQYDLTNPSTRQHRGQALVACVFIHLGLRSEVSTAIYVADRESGFYPFAYNPSGCGGLFQMMLRYWPDRKAAFLPQRLWPRPGKVSWTNALANTYVAAGMVKAGGWGPWAL